MVSRSAHRQGSDKASKLPTAKEATQIFVIFMRSLVGPVLLPVGSLIVCLEIAVAHSVRIDIDQVKEPFNCVLTSPFNSLCVICDSKIKMEVSRL